jgi:hypothetical protein
MGCDNGLFFLLFGLPIAHLVVLAANSYHVYPVLFNPFNNGSVRPLDLPVGLGMGYRGEDLDDVEFSTPTFEQVICE